VELLLGIDGIVPLGLRFGRILPPRWWVAGFQSLRDGSELRFLAVFGIGQMQHRHARILAALGRDPEYHEQDLRFGDVGDAFHTADYERFLKQSI
jgi:hypothetical protein